MKNIYKHSERGFEKLTSVAITILGNSITFIVALCTVIFWLSIKQFYMQDIQDSIRDLIVGVTFLCLFIIQKSFNRSFASLNLKLNELIASHETASNSIISIEDRTEQELTELSKEYAELAEEVKDEKEKS